MYFLFVLQQKGYPVFDVFEEDIRNIETYRFSKNLDEEYKKIYYEIRKRNFKKCKRKIDFVKSVEDIKIPKLSERNEEQSQSDLQSEFPLGFGLPPVAQKPEGVPNLNFKKIKNQNEDSITKGLLDKLKEKNQSSLHGDYYFNDNNLTESEGECDCEECLKEREKEGNQDISTQRQDTTEYIQKELQPEEKDERNRRIEKLLKEGNTDNYRLLRDINKLQDIAESFSTKTKKK